ncbi:nucleotide pyrophosphohydrolase [Paenisporosarcina indica]|uniref:nucleotide pyrophosphohydrolase n=1 Tax=Paenisporosarcina indica TaxID=650093 RepID=UPI00095013AB|nr:nucleotide pyrophosphohydrolase [Paenisporosarcina indica]
MNTQKTMNTLQKEVDDYIGQFKEGYFPPFEMLARMTEELGELAREVQHVHGMKKKKSTEAQKSMEEELGDLLFVLICFANAEKINMQQAHDRVMEKFKVRDQHRWTLKEE